MITGVVPILVTPLNEDESLDFESLACLIEFMIGVGVQGITILGVLGESNRLNDDERAALIQKAVRVAKQRIIVIVGTSHAGTTVARHYSRVAQDLGADAVMLTPAKDVIPDEDRVVDSFRRIAEGVSIPIILQDHPASSEVHMSVSFMLRLLESIPQIQCIKEEAVPTAPKIRKLRERLGNSTVAILTGLGALYAPFDLEAGSNGFNTGFAFPEVLLAMLEAARVGNWDRVHSLYAWFSPLIVFEQQPGVAIRKELLRRRALIKSAQARHPNNTISAAISKQLDGILQRTLPGVDITRPIAMDETLILERSRLV